MPRWAQARDRHLQRVLVVLGGGAAGSTARLAVGTAVGWEPGGWPMASLALNIAGAGAVGWFLARLARASGRWWSIDFWAIGVLGSFTTFSALSVETVTLLDAGRVAAGLAYALTSAVAGVIAAGVGQRWGNR